MTHRVYESYDESPVVKTIHNLLSDEHNRGMKISSKSESDVD